MRASAKLVDLKSGTSFDLGSMYNGNRLAGPPVVWDPFKKFGNVLPEDEVILTVCLVDGPSDTSGSRCATTAQISKDG